MSEANPAQPLVVAGVDGSPQALVALTAAIQEARLRSARLLVVYAYAVLENLTGTTGGTLYAHAETEAKELLQSVASNAPSTEGIEAEWRGVPGNPAEALVEASDGATLLVVGSRGLGGFKGLLVGSVSNQCVHHAKCPVLVVRAEGSKDG